MYCSHCTRMKNSIKLRKTPAFMVGLFVATFAVLLVLFLGMSYGVAEWWNHRSDPSFYSFKFNVSSVLMALLITIYLSRSKTPVLLTRCNESGLRWKHLEPNSMCTVLALVRGVGDTNEHLVIVQALQDSNSLTDGIAITSTTNQMDYFEHELLIKPGDCVFLAGTIRHGLGNTTRLTCPIGFDTGCWRVSGASYIDLDHEVFAEPVVTGMEEEEHRTQLV